MTKDSNIDFQLFEFNLKADIRVDQYLSNELPDLSRSYIQKLIASGSLELDGKVITRSSFKSKNEARGILKIPPENQFEIHPTDIEIQIIFQNENFAVVHKPAGMTIHPGAGTGNDTLVHALLGKIDSLSDGSHPGRPGILHRLDRATEGLILIAKNNHSHYKLSELFKNREITKRYRAFVWGTLSGDKFIQVNGYIDRHPVERKKMRFSREKLSESSKPALHEYRIIRSGEIFSYAEINLITGRTHQIRAFFKSIGNPIIGDSIYSNPSKQKNQYKEKLGNRSFPLDLSITYLKAYYLSFVSPFDGKKVEFSLPMNDWDSLNVF